MDFPEKFESRMKDMLGDEFPLFKDSFSGEDVFSGIRLNPLKTTFFPEFLKDSPGVPWCKDGYYVDKNKVSGNHPYHIGGMFYFQEPSAMSVSDALSVSPGDFVLDLCAAPGGKATQAGAKLEGEGLIIANEIVPSRAKILAENMERFGIKNAVITNESPKALEEKFPEFFDKIIVDAPCSGEGMFRKEPQALTEWSYEHTVSCAARQKNIIDSACAMLKKGGRLIYSTCTFAPEENEGVCLYILENYPDMKLVPLPLPMLEDGKGEYINSSIDFSCTKRIFPHKHHGEGHFLALFEKAGKGEKYIPSFKSPDKQTKDAISLYRTFEKDSLKISLEGDFRLFGENLYLVPMGINLDKIKTVRAGLHLGICKKGRFEPSHALALALSASDFKNTENFPPDSLGIKQYLHGDTVPSSVTGWCGVLCDGLPLGWGKGSGTILKNHFPKGYRLNY